MEEHDCMDALDSVGESQLSYSADTGSESNSNSTCCSSSLSTKTISLSLLDRLCAYSIKVNEKVEDRCQFSATSRKETGVGTEKKNYYKNNRVLFWELENRIIERKKRIMC